jgi:uncharacterized membrane-anchored protein
MPVSKISATEFTYSNTTEHYSIELPNGWVQIPQNTINQAVQVLIKTATTNNIVVPEYTAGFQPEAKNYFQYPYLLIQKLKGTGISPNELAEVFKNTTALENLTKKLSITSNTKIENPYLDIKRNALVYTMTTDYQGIGTIKNLNVLILGKVGVTQLLFYSPESQYSMNLPLFNSIFESFKFNEGFEYIPKSKSAINSVGWIVAGILGGACVLLLRKRKLRDVLPTNIN